MTEIGKARGGSVDRDRIARAVKELLCAVGADPESAELLGTPARVAEAYSEFFAGIGEDPAQFLGDTLPVGADTGELVLLRDITLRSMCEHHLLPFVGRAHIAYQPAERVVGLSALPRVIDTLAARPQLQERLGEEIAETLNEHLSPRGVLVVLEASHGCVAQRGVRQEQAVTVTLAARGTLADPVLRAEAMCLIGRSAAQPIDGDTSHGSKA